MEGVSVFIMEKYVVLVLWLSWVTVLAGQDAPLNTVFYQCNKTSISVAVKSDPLKNRLLLDPRSLTLGKCPVSSTTALQGFLVFEYKLFDCGFSRMVFGNVVKFFTDLVYKPDAAAANVFPQPFRKQMICLSNISMIPTPIESAVVMHVSGIGKLDFSSQFMNDDFSMPSGVKEFFLGSSLFLAISVKTGNHMPLQLFVDEAIVAPTNDLSTSEKRYVLINNHGCFVDGKVASSRFVEPLQLDTIRLTFQAMKLVDNDEVYLHFKLIVWDPKTVTGLKACSYLSDINRWQLLGNPQSNICSCCDSTCKLSSRRKRDAEGKGDAGIIHTMVLGPFRIHSPPVNGSQNAINESKSLEPVSAFQMPPVVGALFLELAVLVLLLLGVAVYSRSANQEYKELEKHALITVTKSL